MHRTPLYEKHLASGAKVVDFNGWLLPLQFGGILREHDHTRTKVAVFDCSHMGEYVVKGLDAIQSYSDQIISDVSAVPAGRCRYGAILTEEGGILDDLITFRIAQDELYVVTNAGPMQAVTDRLEAIPGIEHVSFETAKIDVQGPLARDTVLAAGLDAAEDLKYFNAVWTEWRRHRVLLSRTGYTGELGYELFMENGVAESMWDALLSLPDVAPAGLGARDTLRTEVGYGLSGQDFNTNVTPLEAGMSDFVAWDIEFVGKEALAHQRDRGDYRVLTGIRTSDRRAPRHGFEVFNGDDTVGEVTSGTFGPSVGHGVGLARVEQRYASPGTALEAGPRRLAVEIAEPPFYTDGTCRMKLEKHTKNVS